MAGHSGTVRCVMLAWACSAHLVQVMGTTLLFSPRAQGRLDVANLTVTVTAPWKCAGICAGKRICSMFSVRKITGMGRTNLFQCNVTYGFSSWTPDENSSLYVGKLAALLQ